MRLSIVTNITAEYLSKYVAVGMKLTNMIYNSGVGFRAA